MVWEFDLISEDNPLWAMVYASMFFGILYLLKEGVVNFLNDEAGIFELLKAIVLFIGVISLILREYFGIDLIQILDP